MALQGRTSLVFRGAIALAVLALTFTDGACTQEAPRPRRNSSDANAQRTIDVNTGIGFANHEKLVQHFRKHGREFGPITMDEYLRRAQELRDRPGGGPILECEKNDGVTTRFDRTTGAFVAFNANRTIRTFFRPNDGEQYFHRQCARKEDG